MCCDARNIFRHRVERINFSVRPIVGAGQVRARVLVYFDYPQCK